MENEPKGNKDEETFLQKLQRKCTADPLVPFGCLVTVGFLMAGLRAFRKGQKQNAQMLMRGRVAAQAFTVIVVAVGAFYGIKPHDRPATYEEKLKKLNEK